MRRRKPAYAACAKPDLEVIAFFETHGEAGDPPQAIISNAVLQFIDARSACLAGRIDEALSIYSKIRQTEPATVAEKK